LLIVWHVMCDTGHHGWSETCGCPGQANNLAPLQTNILENFQRRRWLVNIFEGGMPRLWIIFGESFLYVETWLY